jgi:hypothetical protein
MRGGAVIGSPREAITSLICGYPSHIRKDRWLALHVSYLDESDKGGPFFTVGALMAKAEDQWLVFSDLWQSVLDAPPAIPHFHFSKTQGLAEAAHWAKIDAFIEIINNIEPLGALQLIHTNDFRELYGGKVSATYNNPCHMGYIAAIQQCATWQLAPGSVIDWVFDQIDDTAYLEILASYRHFKKTCLDKDVVTRLGQDPICRDDQKVLPLQAADLFAGLWRRAYQGDDKAKRRYERMEVPCNPVVWDKNKLAQVWKANVAINPALPTGKLYEEGKARSARLADARKALRRAEGKE